MLHAKFQSLPTRLKGIRMYSCWCSVRVGKDVTAYTPLLHRFVTIECPFLSTFALGI